LKHLHGHNIVSDGTVNGSLQVPGNGQPIVLMRDRGTSGGYPKIATVISADFGRFAQIPAGRTFRFRAVSMAEAQAEARKFTELLRTLPERLRSIESVDLNIDALHDANVAGHAVSLGAHPGYRDLHGFGRRPIPGLKSSEIENLIAYQIGALQAIATAAGYKVTHVKAHGALSNVACEDDMTAKAIANGIKAVDP